MLTEEIQVTSGLRKEVSFLMMQLCITLFQNRSAMVLLTHTLGLAGYESPCFQDLLTSAQDLGRARRPQNL